MSVFMYMLSSMFDVLRKQVLCGVINVIVSKRCHGVVTVVVVWLESNVESFLLSYFFCCGNEVLGEQLALLVEVVAGTLEE